MISPESETALASIIKTSRTPFKVQGGGTRPIGTTSATSILSTSGLKGVELYEPGALTIVAKAGTPLAEVEHVLAAEGQRLAFEPMDHRGLLGTDGTPTIGGVVAGNVSGPRRIQVGACRDFLLGVRFVDGQGNIVKNGGRVMKNVTGYDLVKLMAGSFGTLGVLTEVSLKVLPKPKSTGVLLLEGLSDEQAIQALSKALGSPFDVSGAVHVTKGLDGSPVTMIRLEGFENSVEYRADKLGKLLDQFGNFSLETDADKTAAGWKWVRDVVPFQGREGDIWRLSVKPTDAPGVVDSLGDTEALYDWGGGLVWLFVPKNSKISASDIRHAVSHVGGHATLIRGNAETQTFQPLPETLEVLQAGLRRQFDPQGLFNPGLMGAKK